MKLAIYIITTLYFFISVLGDMVENCKFVNFYQELGCTALPSVDNDTKTCPEEFACPDLNTDPNRCYYRGVSYADRAMLPEDQIESYCSVDCHCSLKRGPKFTCAEVDCAENDNNEEECISTFEFDSCCSTGVVCGKDAIAALKTCEVDGTTYYEGQYFAPLNSNKRCYCNGTWNGSLEDTTICKTINCGIEIHDQKSIFEKCAPVFVKTVKSCPFIFECPTPKTKIIKGINLRGIASQCFFGNMTINVGDEVLVEDECTKCTCEVPPFVTCMKTAYTCGH